MQETLERLGVLVRFLQGLATPSYQGIALLRLLQLLQEAFGLRIEPSAAVLRVECRLGTLCVAVSYSGNKRSAREQNVNRLRYR